jgi:hypothetical protein
MFILIVNIAITFTLSFSFSFFVPFGLSAFLGR